MRRKLKSGLAVLLAISMSMCAAWTPVCAAETETDFNAETPREMYGVESKKSELPKNGEEICKEEGNAPGISERSEITEEAESVSGVQTEPETMSEAQPKKEESSGLSYDTDERANVPNGPKAEDGMESEAGSETEEVFEKDTESSAEFLFGSEAEKTTFGQEEEAGPDTSSGRMEGDERDSGFRTEEKSGSGSDTAPVPEEESEMPAAPVPGEEGELLLMPGREADSEMDTESATEEKNGIESETESDAEEQETELQGQEEPDGKPYHIYVVEDDHADIHFDGEVFVSGETVSFDVSAADGRMIQKILVKRFDTGTSTAGAAIEIQEKDSCSLIEAIGAEAAKEMELSDWESELLSGDLFGTYTFQMPNSDVVVMAETESLISTYAEADDVEAVPDKIILKNYETLPALPQKWQALPTNEAWTRTRKVIFQTEDGMKTVVNAYCLEPNNQTPGDGTYDKGSDRIQTLDTGAKEKNLSKALFYLYGGPGYGKAFELEDGTKINFKQLFEDTYGLDADGIYCLTHYVLGCIYNNEDRSVWNANTGVPGVINEAGMEAVESVVAKIKQLDVPNVTLSSASLSVSSLGNGTVRSSSTRYKAVEENYGTIKLGRGITLVNETSGERGTGTVKIAGGDKFHLESDGTVSGTRTYTIRTTYSVDYTAFALKTPGVQDIGFAYYAGSKELAFDVAWPESGSVKLKKVNAETNSDTTVNGNYSLAGAVYTVYRDAALTNAVGTLTTDAHGSTAPVKLDVGTYYVKETAAPKGFQKDVQIHQVTVSSGETATVSVSDLPIYAKPELFLKKLTSGGYSQQLSVYGAQFRVEFFVSENAEGTPERTWILETDQNGEIWLQDECKVSGDAFYGDGVLPLGSIKVTEVKAPAGLAQKPDPVIVNIVQDGENASFQTIEFEDDVCFGGFRLKKSDSESRDTAQGDASLEGAVFAVYSDNDYAVIRQDDPGKTYAKGDEVCRIKTDANGIAQTPTIAKDGQNMQILMAGAYTVKEIEPPIGYLKNDGYSCRFTITEDGEICDTTADVVREDIIRGGFRLQKWDQEKNTAQPQGDATLAGAEFTLINRSVQNVLVDVDGDGIMEVYDPGDVIRTYQTDQDGRIETREDFLPYGTYELKETKAPAGYTQEGENLTRTFSVREDHIQMAFDTETTAAKDRVIHGDISLFKFADAPSGEDAEEDVTPIEGVEFTVTLKSTGKQVCTVRTDSLGFATTRDADAYPHGRLPYGEYVIHENPETVPEGFDTVSDFTVFVGRVDAVLGNAGTGDTVFGEYIDGHNYIGYYKNDRPIEMPLTLVKIDAESGKAVLLANTEFQILDKDKKVITFYNHYPQPQELENFCTDETGSVTLPQKLAYGTYYIHEVKAPYGYLKGNDAQFRITRWGAWEHPVILSYADVPVKGKLVITKYDAETQEKLSGSVFEIYADEDILTGDGEVHAQKGDLVDTVTIENDGTAVTEELYLGRYYAAEVKAPKGYYLDREMHTFELKYQDQDTAVVYAHMDVANRSTSLELIKNDIDGRILEGVTFSLAQIGKVTDSDLIQDKTEQEEIYVTDETGRFSVKYLAPGIYALKEMAALPGYVSDQEASFFTVDEDGAIYLSDANGNKSDHTTASDCLSITKTNDYTKVDFSKTDVSGTEELPGARMQLLDRTGTEVYSWISGTKPYRISRIPVGSYTLVETAAPDGYVTAEKIPFEVSDTGAVQIVQMQDDVTKLTVSKKDLVEGEGGNEIPGAKLVIKNSEGSEVEQWTSTDEPHYIEKLPIGSYTLTEITAPYGYEMAETVQFEITDSPNIQKVIMFDAPYREVEISKQDITGKEIPGAELIIKDKEEKEVERWISTDKPHHVKLPSGDYTLTEITAPYGYATAETISFTVKRVTAEDYEIDRVKMLDRPIQVQFQKTDESGNQLTGAVLCVTDQNGREMERFTTTTEAYCSIGKLACGETYTLTELSAPSGYQLADPVQFTVEDTAEIQIVSMTDTPVSDGSITKRQVIPKTGDSAQILHYGMLLLCSAAVLTILLLKKGEKGKHCKRE